MGEFLLWLSDHCPLLFALEIKSNPETSSTKPAVKNAPKQYVWKEGDITRFIEVLNSPEFEEILANIMNLNSTNPNAIVDPLTELLLKVADKADVKRKTHSKNSSPDNPPWFDQNCTKLKNKIRELGKK